MKNRTVVCIVTILLCSMACSFSHEIVQAPPSSTRVSISAVSIPNTVVPVVSPTAPLSWKCVTAEKALWLRSQPWETSKPVIPNALLAGTRLQVYPAPFAQRWVQVIVPELGVSGWVNSKYIGDCQ